MKKASARDYKTCCARPGQLPSNELTMHEDCQTVRNRDYGTREKQRLSTVSRVPCSHDPSARATGGRSLSEYT